MIPLSLRTQLTVFLALGVTAAMSIWVMAVPSVMSMSTYTALTALVLGVATVTLNSSRNAQSPGSLGELLYETEHPPRARRREGSL